MSASRLGLLMAVSAWLVCSTAYAEGWLASWLPGKKESAAEPAAKTPSTRTPLLGGKPLRHSTRTSSENDASVWSRMGNGTRNLVGRTKERLSFQGAKKEDPHHTNWDDKPKPRASRKAKEEPSLWARMFQRDEPRPSKTVPDFLSQPRPEQGR